MYIYAKGWPGINLEAWHESCTHPSVYGAAVVDLDEFYYFCPWIFHGTITFQFKKSGKYWLFTLLLKKIEFILNKHYFPIKTHFVTNVS